MNILCYMRKGLSLTTLKLGRLYHFGGCILITWVLNNRKPFPIYDQRDNTTGEGPGDAVFCLCKWKRVLKDKLRHTQIFNNLFKHVLTWMGQCQKVVNNAAATGARGEDAAAKQGNYLIGYILGSCLAWECPVGCSWLLFISFIFLDSSALTLD